MNQIISQTCTEMLEQRGYTVEQKDGLIFGKSIIDNIVIFHSDNGKLTVARILEFISQMKDLNINHCIIVQTEPATHVAKKVIEEIENIKIELFEEKTLRYNITKHRLVPKHTALSKAESIHFRKKYGMKIPVILSTDPIARFYFFQKGDIIKIERSDGFVSFRIVK